MDARLIRGNLCTGMTASSIHARCYHLSHSCRRPGCDGVSSVSGCLSPSLRSPPSLGSCGAHCCPGELGTWLPHSSTVRPCPLDGDMVPTAVLGTFKLPVVLRRLFACVSGQSSESGCCQHWRWSGSRAPGCVTRLLLSRMAPPGDRKGQFCSQNYRPVKTKS